MILLIKIYPEHLFPFPNLKCSILGVGVVKAKMHAEVIEENHGNTEDIKTDIIPRQLQVIHVLLLQEPSPSSSGKSDIGRCRNTGWRYP
jgi:hypothetical protein